MALTQDDHMVEQITTTVADETFCNAILPGAFERSANGFHAKDFRRCQDLRTESGIAVVNQIARRGIVWKCLAQLLTHPGAGWMSRHIEMKNSPPVVRDDKEAIENAEGECWHGEEVHRCDGFAMIAQKGRPSLCWLRTPGRFPHPAQNASFRNIEAEHLQFAMNARRTPSFILRDHAKDEIAQFPACRLPAGSYPFAGYPVPVEPEPGTVPANDRLRLHDEERLLPSRPDR